MPSSSRVLSFLPFVVAFLLAVAGPALAGGPTAQEREEAKRLYTEGRRLRDEGKLAEAVDRFKRAHDLAPTPVTRLELARALEAQGKLVDAHALAATVASMPPTPTETQKSRAARDDAKVMTEALTRRIPRVVVAVTPAGGETEVAIDGRVVGKELLTTEIPVDPGEHHATARRGERSVDRTFTVAESERRSVELTFPEPAPEPPAPAPTTAPVVAAPPPAASTKPSAAPTQPPPAEGRGLTPIVPIAFGVAGVGAATGLVTGLVALSQASSLKTNCPNGRCPAPYHDALSTHQAVATTSTVTFVIAGAAVALGAVVWLADGSGRSGGTAVRLVPLVDPAAGTRLAKSEGRAGFTGLAIDGRF